MGSKVKKKSSKKNDEVKSSSRYAKGLDKVKEFGLALRKSGVEDITHKYVPFRNLALNIITGGGAFEDRVIEIAGDSQTGKSYLAYELGGIVLQNSGHVYINDNESAFEDAYGVRSGFPEGSEYFVSEEKDIQKIFSEMRETTRLIRASDKTGLIVFIIDSYGGLSTKIDMADEEAKKDPRGYMAKHRANLWNEKMKTFVGFLKKHHCMLVIVNQAKLDKDNATPYFKPYKSLAEDVIKFWCTQRILMLAKGKIYDEDKDASDDKKKKKSKKVLGQKVQVECIKNRTTAPFQKCIVDMYFEDGIDMYSGLEDLLLDKKLIKVKEEKEGRKKVKKFVNIGKKKIYSSIAKLVEADPEIVKPSNHFSTKTISTTEE